MTLSVRNPVRSAAPQLRVATPADAAAVAAVRNAAAADLTSRYGTGGWSNNTSERGVLFDMRRGTVYVATYNAGAVATLMLSIRKPWAVNKSYFSPSAKPLYLTAMAVVPERQRQGIGTECLVQAAEFARSWPADTIRLDAWDHASGAGAFYAKCGYREVGRAQYRGAALVYFELPL